MNGLFLQGVSFDWDRVEPDSYLRRIAAFQGLSQLRFACPVTFFEGENGSGKSTLLEAIAVAQGFNPEGGTKNYAFSTRDTHSELHEAIRLVRGYRREKWGYFLRAESFYNVATQEEQYADLAHPSAGYHAKSHGESFLALAQNDLRPNGLYLLDEPEAVFDWKHYLYEAFGYEVDDSWMNDGPKMETEWLEEEAEEGADGSDGAAASDQPV